jgi:hypothetical protein
MPLPPELQDTYRAWWQLAQQAATALDPDGGYAYRSTDMISAAAQIMTDTGQSLSMGTSRQLMQLFSIARGNANASDQLSNAEATAQITGSMVGNWPTAAPLSVQDIQPEYMAKGQFTYVNALGEQQTGWITLTGITQLPPTAGNLALRLTGAAQQAYSMTPEEGGTPKTDAEVMAEFGELTSMQIYAV